jgi:hypothetical protein
MFRIALIIAAFTASGAALAQDRSIRILVGFPAGGGEPAPALADYDMWGPVIKASGFKPGS